MKHKLDCIPTRRFGRTEIQIPILSIGGMRFQQSWSDLSTDEVSDENQMNVIKILQFAAHHGLHHLETARHYGTSEIQLGFAMKSVLDEKRIIQTKIPPRQNSNEFEKELEHSFANLQCKSIDLLSIHGLNLPEHLEQTICPGGCLDVVRRWQANGLISHVGFSTHGPTDLIIKAIETDMFDYVNLHWYFIFQDNEPALEAARKRDLGVFIISPTDKGGHLHTPSKKLLKLCSPLHPIVFNDLFCLSDQRVHTLSVGASTIQDFELHFRAVSSLGTTQELLPIIKEQLNLSANISLGKEWINTWNLGLPTWDQTPGKINIPILIWLYNLYKSWGMETYVQARYRLLGNGSHWFPGANSDELDNKVKEDALRVALRFSPWSDIVIERLRELRDKFGGDSTKRLSEI